MKLLTVLLTMALAGCATEINKTAGTVEGNTFCDVYKPMLPSRKDTQESADHLYKYYQLWEKQCKK